MSPRGHEFRVRSNLVEICFEIKEMNIVGSYFIGSKKNTKIDLTYRFYLGLVYD